MAARNSGMLGFWVAIGIGVGIGAGILIGMLAAGRSPK